MPESAPAEIAADPLVRKVYLGSGTWRNGKAL